MKTFDQVAVGEKLLPDFEVRGDNLDTNLLGMAYWASHRIHYDKDWAVGEGYRDVVITGTLMYGWIEKLVTHWAGNRTTVRRYDFRNTNFACVGDKLGLSGTVTGIKPHPDGGGIVECALQVRRDDGSTIVDATAELELP